MPAFKFLVLLWFACSSLIAHGQIQEAVFEDIVLVESDTHTNHQYQLPLGQVKYDRDLNRNRPEKLLNLHGQFNAKLWQITEPSPVHLIQDKINTYISDNGLVVLFNCTGRSCGESFSWANDVFNQPLLYGNDRNQSLWTIEDARQNRYLLFYHIARPNGRQYFYRTVVEVSAQSLDTDTLHNLLSRNGRVFLGEITLDSEDKPDTSQVIRNLSAWPKSDSMLLVIHRHGPALEMELVNPLQRALEKEGFKQYTVEDVANLAPQESVTENIWVDLVDPKWAPKARSTE